MQNLNKIELENSIRTQYEEAIQEKNLSIIELNNQLVEKKKEIEVLQESSRRVMDELGRVRRSYEAQLNRLAEAKLDKLALLIKREFGLVKF